MVASSRQIGYIWEPFNPNHKKGVFRSNVEHFYTYIAGSPNVYETSLADTLAFRYDITSQARSLKNAKDIAQMLISCMKTRLYRAQRRRALIKDPNALLSAAWIASAFDAQVIVLIRHPAAFVNSLIKASWRYPFSHFLEQPGVLSEHLSPFENEIKQAAVAPIDIVDEGILLWRALHYVIAGYRRAHPDWLFVRHEDLSIDPSAAFAPVFKHLGIDYTADMQRQIEVSSRPGNPIERPGEIWPPFARLDSRKNVKRWAGRLTEKQIRRIRVGSEDIWRQFYTDDDWNVEDSEQRTVDNRAEYTLP